MSFTDAGLIGNNSSVLESRSRNRESISDSGVDSAVYQGEVMWGIIGRLLSAGATYAGTIISWKGKKIVDMKPVLDQIVKQFRSGDKVVKSRMLVTASDAANMRLTSEAGFFAWVKKNPIKAIVAMEGADLIAGEAIDLLLEWILDPDELKAEIGPDRDHSALEDLAEMLGFTDDDDKSKLSEEEEHIRMEKLLNGADNLHMLKRVLSRM